eukprot:8615755-Alexandrium_andersonii.AAC.1
MIRGDIPGGPVDADEEVLGEEHDSRERAGVEVPEVKLRSVSVLAQARASSRLARAQKNM